MAKNYVSGAEHFNQPTMHQVHVDAPMTNISIAYRNSAYIADQVFPIVRVQKQSDRFFVFGKAAWFRDEAGVRAPGTRAPRVEYTLATDQYACVEYAAAKSVPDEIVLNSDNPLAPKREATEFATDKLLLRREKDVADKVFGASVWTGSANPGVTWSDDTSDPIADITSGSASAQEKLRAQIGRYGNVMVVGAQVWSVLQRHPDILDRIKYTQTGMITEQLVAALFQVDRLLVGKGIINSANEDATASFADIWGNNVWLGYVPANPGLMTPAAG